MLSVDKQYNFPMDLLLNPKQFARSAARFSYHLNGIIVDSRNKLNLHIFAQLKTYE